MSLISFKKPIKNFIVLEGLDGCGTTTQTALLVKKLEECGIKGYSTKEPTDGSIGRFIRSVLQKKESVDPFTLALLFSADRNEHVYGENGIIEQTQAGKMVVCDRYFFSSLAYQSLFIDYDTVGELNRFYPLPEYLFYIDLSPEECQARVESRGDETELFEHLELQRKIDVNYKKSLSLLAASEMKTVVIDGRGSIEDIHNQICKALGLTA
ncbi:MAG: dTMP kinase [Spirochaetia bacterium]|nr:dTMP kinase [Spirochaetia bacterium]